MIGWKRQNRSNLNEVPTICLENLSPKQLRAYVIADGRLVGTTRFLQLNYKSC